MNDRKRSGSGIFLMEMIMVCGFFLLCAAVCIHVFLRADAMSRLAREKNQAVLAAESLADRWKVYGLGGESEAAFWDQDWNPVQDGQAENPCFAASLACKTEQQTEDGTLESLTIEIGRGSGHSRRKELNGQFLYTLEVKRYIPAGGSGDGKE